jgi:hypothetical protein
MLFDDDLGNTQYTDRRIGTDTGVQDNSNILLFVQRQRFFIYFMYIDVLSVKQSTKILSVLLVQKNQYILKEIIHNFRTGGKLGIF